MGIGRGHDKSHSLDRCKNSLLEGKLAHGSISIISNYKFIRGVILFLSNLSSIFVKRPFGLPFFYLLRLNNSLEFRAEALLAFTK